MKQRNDTVNRNSTALEGAVAAATIGALNLLYCRAGGGERAQNTEAPVSRRAIAHSFCDRFKILRPRTSALPSRFFSRRWHRPCTVQGVSRPIKRKLNSSKRGKPRTPGLVFIGKQEAV
jgi:hypothetical protein